MRLTSGKVIILFAFLTLVFLALLAVDKPVAAPATQNVQVSQLGDGSAYQTSDLSAGSPLVGNVTANAFSGAIPSSYALFVLNDAQYIAWTTSQPHQYTPQAYYYMSGANVNYFGKTNQIEFPINLHINSTDNYYLAVFNYPNQNGQSANLNPQFHLMQITSTPSQQYILRTPTTTFEVLAGISALILALVGISEARSESRRTNPADKPILIPSLLESENPHFSCSLTILRMFM
jgi:hypothetical protein